MGTLIWKLCVHHLDNAEFCILFKNRMRVINLSVANRAQRMFRNANMLPHLNISNEYIKTFVFFACVPSDDRNYHQFVTSLMDYHATVVINNV